MSKLFYEYVEAIDEVDESGYNSITFYSPEKALDYFNRNISHWYAKVNTNDKAFVEQYPNVGELIEEGD